MGACAGELLQEPAGELHANARQGKGARRGQLAKEWRQRTIAHAGVSTEIVCAIDEVVGDVQRLQVCKRLNPPASVSTPEDIISSSSLSAHSRFEVPRQRKGRLARSGTTSLQHCADRCKPLMLTSASSHSLARDASHAGREGGAGALKACVELEGSPSIESQT